MNSVYKKSVFEDAAKTAHLTLQIGESDLLKKSSSEIEPKAISSKKVKTLITKLKKTLLEYKSLTGKGRGIAAVQIGIPLNVAVVFLGEDLLTIVNPRIAKVSKKLLMYPEICMSANPIIAPVIRPAWIEFSYLDAQGDSQTWSDKKNLILNRVFQHEIDHMNGIINIDLVKSKNLILDSDPQFFKKAKFKEVKL